MTRQEARHAIVDAANRRRQYTNRQMTGRGLLAGRSGMVLLKPFSMRSLHQAVRVVRARLLVDDDTLVAAGFNPVPARRRAAVEARAVEVAA